MSFKNNGISTEPELLAPAGSPESLEFAIRYGADAVYLGTDEFSMRTVSRSFTEENLKKNIDFAHDRGVKVYLASNIIAHNSDIARVDSFFKTAAEAGADALIISDLGMLNRAKKIAPALEIHISTQFGVTNFETARVLHELGAK
ncbi:MAG TPA: peptidase U32 family protein, partial [Oscillospiraceae bacterium]|nr:peptidase U32 family protein [Oscillospiraceae bacterium]